MGVKNTRLPLIALGAAVSGVAFAAFLQWITSDYLYPMVVQGKPFGAWQPFMPIMFELGVLFTAFACLFGMLALNGLPEPYHPVFHVPRFEFASRDHFFLCIEATDPKFDPEDTRNFLESLEPREVSDVPS